MPLFCCLSQIALQELATDDHSSSNTPNKNPSARVIGGVELRVSVLAMLVAPPLVYTHAQCHSALSGPLKRLNAILSLLQPLDHYRTPSAIGSAIGRLYLALSRIHAQAEVLNCLVLSRLGGSTAR